MKTSKIHDELLERVRAIDEEAYKNLTEIRDSDGLSEACIYEHELTYSSISCLFIWGNTKQGHEYWSRLNEKIEKENNATNN